NAVSRVASLLSVAVCGAIMLYVFASRLEPALGATDLAEKDRQAIYQQRNQLVQIQLPSGLNDREKTEVRRVVDDSFVAGFRSVALLSALLAALSAVAAWMMLDRAPRTNPTADSRG